MITFEMKKNDKKPLEFAYDMRALSQSFFRNTLVKLKRGKTGKSKRDIPCHVILEMSFSFIWIYR